MDNNMDNDYVTDVYVTTNNGNDSEIGVYGYINSDDNESYIEIKKRDIKTKKILHVFRWDLRNAKILSKVFKKIIKDLESNIKE